MQAYVVVYRAIFADLPSTFGCDATCGDHAEHQCEREFPGCEVLWIVEGSDKDAALTAYYNAQ